MKQRYRGRTAPQFEVEALGKKLAELIEEEIAQVCGGVENHEPEFDIDKLSEIMGHFELVL